MKFSFKDFDYKEFFIQKGEKIGLWAAVGIMALLLIFVIKDVFAGPSASQNAKLITDLSEKGKRDISNSVPTADVQVVPDDIEKGATPKPVDPALYVAPYALFNPQPLEDKKWRLPTVVPADDFIVRYVQEQIPSFIFQQTKEDMQVGVLVAGGDNEGIRKKNQQQRDEERRKKLSPRRRAIEDYLKQMRGGGAGGGMGPMMRPGGGGPMGMPQGGGLGGLGGMPMGGGPGGRMGGMMGGGQMMQMMQNMGGAYGGGMGTGAGGATEYKFKWVSYDKSEQEADWAKTMLPYRMVIVTGAFPLKQEMETFRQALRFPDVEKMLEGADFEFSGLTVERREAKTFEELQKQKWELLDVETNLKTVMIRAAGKEPDDPKLESSGIIFKPNRIFMPLPKLEDELHKDNKYPEDLPKSIQDTLEAIEKAGKPTGMAKRKKSRSDIVSYDLFDEGDQQADPNAVPAQDPNKPQGTLVNEQAGPDKCLVRFVDVAVRPGMVYEYRIKVRMINPNYENKEKAVSKAITVDQQIEAREWTVIPEKVKIPEEKLFFAVDEKRSEGAVMNPDRVPIQVQRWLDVVQSDPKNSSSEVPVGEWSILERIWAHRGEYIGETREVEVPIWVTTMKKFLFAVHADDTPLRKKGVAAPRAIKHKGIPVNFDTETLLVDFEGGKRYYPVGAAGKVLDEGPVELLVLSPDGKKLLVRNGRTDTDNPERKKHVEEWKTVQEKVKEEVENMKGSGKKERFQFGGSGTR